MSPPQRVVVAVLFVLACATVYRAAQDDETADERWLGLVYRDRNDLTRHDVVGEFGSLNECLDRVRDEVDQRGAYECGLNCRSRPSGLNICERTVGNER